MKTILIYLFLSINLTAATYFISPEGDDSNNGNIDTPFASLQLANKLVKPGDTVYIRGGLYKIQNEDIARFDKKLFARVIYFKTSGTKNSPIIYQAYKNEKPIFDFSAVKPANHRVYAFSVSGSWLHFKGIEVTGVQVTMKGHTQSISFENNGSHNIFELLTMRDSQAIGYYSTRGSHNLVLNCDAFNNWGYTSEGGKGGNVDGFGIHPRKGDKGNIIRGCRAWFNSDDGYDLINSGEAVIIENCWAAYNGFTKDFKSAGDGNGFKAGGYGSTDESRLPSPIPRHIVKNSFAMGNKQSGFYANHHIGGIDWLNNIAYQNKKNFNMLSRMSNNKTDVPGYGHLLKNNAGYKSKNKTELININRAKCTLENNTFQAETSNHEALKKFNKEYFFKPRKENGDLPDLDCLRD